MNVSSWLKVTRKLLSAGADVNALAVQDDFYSMSPLHLAIAHASVDMTKELIQAGADVNQLCFMVPEEEHGGISPLTRSLQKVDPLEARLATPDMVPLLIQAGADVIEASPKGVDHLYETLQRDIPFKFHTIIDKLVAAGADVNRVRENGDTPLTFLLINEQGRAKTVHPEKLQCVKVLLQHGVEARHLGLEFAQCLSRDFQRLLCIAGVSVWGYYTIFDCLPYRISWHKTEAFMVVRGGGKVELGLPEPHDPFNLKSLCRRSIRGHMMRVSRVNLFVRVPKLPLPKAMRECLLYGVNV